MIKYCESIFTTKRWKTRQVLVGNVGVGGNNPIRIQSMTTSSTRDSQATIDQIMRLSDAGCEIARVTVQGMKEADACEEIKNRLLQRGYTIPLVADIHFFPPAAMRVIDFVDKVRVNPGNYIDKRASFKSIEYNDESYAKEIDKIEEKFTPLVEKCKRLKRAMRIGTNHGSLSDRIMNRYGDTPLGMVESALEFARVCRRNAYHDFMFSMKASNPLVMIQAYRLLVAEMMNLSWDYPLHLGVTEAGEGEDGRIKSAMGIGTLLFDGLGDTIRISLTEDAWQEIDPCQRLVRLANEYQNKGVKPFVEFHRHISSIKRRHVIIPKDLALHRDGTVIIGVQANHIEEEDFIKKLGYEIKQDLPKLTVSSADMIVISQKPQNAHSLQILRDLQNIGLGIISMHPCEQTIPLLTLPQASTLHMNKARVERFTLSLSKKNSQQLALIIKDESPSEWSLIKDIQPSLIILSPTDHRLHVCRYFFEWLQTEKIHTPVILHFNYTCSKEDLIIRAAAECGALICDGLGDGLWIDGPYDINFLRQLSFNILQAARLRTSKTDFISCPSCGRTLFDLQDVSKRIRERTAHLPGVKIAIMGCIVNGPGEMADADFGYVGSKPGKIDLYVGKECVEKDIDFVDADDRLINLIKQHNRWVNIPSVIEKSCFSSLK
jgi:(E)-4-hydroxy-3-methylbut-2-enyl-diphosphate synthase